MHLNKLTFSGSRVLWSRIAHRSEIADFISSVLEEFRDLLPSERDSASVLLKPNCNNDLHSLTGNSTDLRVIAATVNALRDRGFRNLTLGDGPNVGINRLGVDVFGRLGVSGLTKAIGVKLSNLNHQPTLTLRLQNRWNVRIAREVKETDLIVNLPKLKTHQEAGLSLSVKNMMGCVSGLCKKTVHEDLIPNLVELALSIKPRVNVVDGIISMEGNGPGDGNPVRTGFLAAGEEPFILDLAVARLSGFDLEKLPMTEVLLRRNLIDPGRLEEIREKIEPIARMVPAPPRTLVSTVIGHNRLAWARDLTRWLFYRKPILDFCYRYKIIQDMYSPEEADISGMRLDRDECTGCRRCMAVCPCSLPILSPDFDFTEECGCVQCLSCVLICPTGAIRFEGNPGYLTEHLERYGVAIRALPIPVDGMA